LWGLLTLQGGVLMTHIAFIPGAGNLACSMWPLQAKDDTSIHAVDYARGFSQEFPRESGKLVLQHYAERIFAQLLQLDQQVDLYAWSMAAPVSLAVAKRADIIAPGLIRNIMMITPAPFHGAPKYPFHQSMSYGIQFLFPSSQLMSQIASSVREIKEEIPDFSYEVPEPLEAMRESGDGVIKIPRGFDRSRIRMYYAQEDTVIPEDISLHMAKRAGVVHTPIAGYGHNVPLFDTEGVVLQRMRTENA